MPTKNPQVFVIIPAAGHGSRMGSALAKQFIEIGGKTILQHTCDKFLAWGKATQILIGLSSTTDFNSAHSQISTYHGGKERADTVLLGLQTLQTQANADDWVLVHDAARPLINIKDLNKLFDTLIDDKVGGILAEQATSTVKEVTDNVIQKHSHAHKSFWHKHHKCFAMPCFIKPYNKQTQLSQTRLLQLSNWAYLLKS